MNNKQRKIVEMLILFIFLALGLFSKEVIYILIGAILFVGVRVFFDKIQKNK